jgi:hypothetical protein
MADIRINALATTAASTASDDFVAVDGSANGTRKLNAYSPTFGGNLTVSGTGGISIGSATFTGGRALTATTGSGNNVSLRLLQTSVADWEVQNVATTGALAFSQSGSALMSLSATGNVGIGETNPTSRLVVRDDTGTTLKMIKLQTGFSNPSGNKSIVWSDATNDLGRISVSYDAANGSRMAFGSLYSGGYQSSDLMTLASTGNLLVGTTIDGGQKLQVSGTAYVSGNLSSGARITAGNGFTATSTVPTVVAASSNLDYNSVGSKGRLFVWGPDSGTVGAFELNLANSTNSSLITALSFASSGDATFAGSVTTAAPTGGTAKPWKVGQYNATAPSATGYVEVDINGTLYKLLAST